MSLELVLDTVPEELKAFYVATTDGKFALDVKGVISEKDHKSKVNEFRDTNIKLQKDLEKFKSFADVLGSEKLDAEGLSKKVEDLVEGRLGARAGEMKTKLEAEINTWKEMAEKSKARVSQFVLDNEVTKAATEHGVLGSALEDVMFRAKTMFEVVDDEVRPKDGAGDSSGKPYTIKTWVEDLKGKATHLFGQSSGTGAGKGGIVLNVGTPVKPGSQRKGVDLIEAGLKNNGSAAKKSLHSK